MRALWRRIGLVSAVCTVVLMFGFGYAVHSVVFPQGGGVETITNGPEESKPNKDQINIVAIGDSLTVGTGDESGKGYVLGVKERLDERVNIPVYVLGNFAQNGYTTTQILADVTNRNGIQEAIRKADIVLMTAGGNDLFRLGDEVNPEVIRGRFPEALANIQKILAKIRDINDNAHVYYVGLYNPFIDLELFEGSTETVQDWNTEVFRLAEQFDRVTFVSTFDLFENDVNRFLSSDYYHPNQDGYDRIARHIALLLE